MFQKNIFSNLLSVLALCISLIALGFALNQKENGIIFGTSNSTHHLIEHEGEQIYVFSLPLEFHNSSNNAISLESFKTQNLLKLNKTIEYKLFLSHVHLGSVPSLWIKQLKKEKAFDISKPINHIIRANQSYKFNLVILFEKFEYIKEADGIVSFKALFSNDQTIHVEQPIKLGE